MLKQDSEFSFENPYDKVRVTLNDNNEALLEYSTQSVKGTWTMMYDQGIIIETDGARIIFNFKYVLKPEFYDKVEDVSSSSYEAFDTKCSETMMGFV